MSPQIAIIDKNRNIQLTDEMCRTSGIQLDTEVIIEATKNGIFIRPKIENTPLTNKLINMQLPVADWEQLENEIEKGHL